MSSLDVDAVMRALDEAYGLVARLYRQRHNNQLAKGVSCFLHTDTEPGVTYRDMNREIVACQAQMFYRGRASQQKIMSWLWRLRSFELHALPDADPLHSDCDVANHVWVEGLVVYYRTKLADGLDQLDVSVTRVPTQNVFPDTTTITTERGTSSPVNSIFGAQSALSTSLTPGCYSTATVTSSSVVGKATPTLNSMLSEIDRNSDRGNNDNMASSSCCDAARSAVHAWVLTCAEMSEKVYLGDAFLRCVQIVSEFLRSARLADNLIARMEQTVSSSNNNKNSSGCSSGENAMNGSPSRGVDNFTRAAECHDVERCPSLHYSLPAIQDYMGTSTWQFHIFSLLVGSLKRYHHTRDVQRETRQQQQQCQSDGTHKDVEFDVPTGKATCTRDTPSARPVRDRDMCSYGRSLCDLLLCICGAYNKMSAALALALHILQCVQVLSVRSFAAPRHRLCDMYSRLYQEIAPHTAQMLPCFIMLPSTAATALSDVLSSLGSSVCMCTLAQQQFRQEAHGDERCDKNGNGKEQEHAPIDACHCSQDACLFASLYDFYVRQGPRYITRTVRFLSHAFHRWEWLATVLVRSIYCSSIRHTCSSQNSKSVNEAKRNRKANSTVDYNLSSHNKIFGKESAQDTQSTAMQMAEGSEERAAIAQESASFSQTAGVSSSCQDSAEHTPVPHDHPGCLLYDILYLLLYPLLQRVFATHEREHGINDVNDNNTSASLGDPINSHCACPASSQCVCSYTYASSVHAFRCLVAASCAHIVVPDQEVMKYWFVLGLGAQELSENALGRQTLCVVMERILAEIIHHRWRQLCASVRPSRRTVGGATVGRAEVDETQACSKVKGPLGNNDDSEVSRIHERRNDRKEVNSQSSANRAPRAQNAQHLVVLDFLRYLVQICEAFTALTSSRDLGTTLHTTPSAQTQTKQTLSNNAGICDNKSNNMPCESCNNECADHVMSHTPAHTPRSLFSSVNESSPTLLSSPPLIPLAAANKHYIHCLQQLRHVFYKAVRHVLTTHLTTPHQTRALSTALVNTIHCHLLHCQTYDCAGNLQLLLHKHCSRANPDLHIETSSQVATSARRCAQRDYESSTHLCRNCRNGFTCTKQEEHRTVNPSGNNLSTNGEDGHYLVHIERPEQLYATLRLTACVRDRAALLTLYTELSRKRLLNRSESSSGISMLLMKQTDTPNMRTSKPSSHNSKSNITASCRSSGSSSSSKDRNEVCACAECCMEAAIDERKRALEGEACAILRDAMTLVSSGCSRHESHVNFSSAAMSSPAGVTVDRGDYDIRGSDRSATQVYMSIVSDGEGDHGTSNSDNAELDLDEYRSGSILTALCALKSMCQTFHSTVFHTTYKLLRDTSDRHRGCRHDDDNDPCRYKRSADRIDSEEANANVRSTEHVTDENEATEFKAGGNNSSKTDSTDNSKYYHSMSSPTKSLSLVVSVLDYRSWGYLESSCMPDIDHTSSTTAATSAGHDPLPLPYEVQEAMRDYASQYAATHTYRRLRWCRAAACYSIFTMDFPRNQGRTNPTRVHTTLLIHQIFLALLNYGRAGVSYDVLARRIGLPMTALKLAHMLRPFVDQYHLLVTWIPHDSTSSSAHTENRNAGNDNANANTEVTRTKEQSAGGVCCACVYPTGNDVTEMHSPDVALVAINYDYTYTRRRYANTSAMAHDEEDNAQPACSAAHLCSSSHQYDRQYEEEDDVVYHWPRCPYAVNLQHTMDFPGQRQETASPLQMRRIQVALVQICKKARAVSYDALFALLQQRLAQTRLTRHAASMSSLSAASSFSPMSASCTATAGAAQPTSWGDGCVSEVHVDRRVYKRALEFLIDKDYIRRVDDATTSKCTYQYVP